MINKIDLDEPIIRLALQDFRLGAKINRIVINNIRYTDDAMLIAESEKIIKSGKHTSRKQQKKQTQKRKRVNKNSYRTTLDDSVLVCEYLYLGRLIKKKRTEIARYGLINMRKILWGPKLSIAPKL